MSSATQSKLCLGVKVDLLVDFSSSKMESAFDNLDAAGFLEIWQHFDADGEGNF